MDVFFVLQKAEILLNRYEIVLVFAVKWFKYVDFCLSDVLFFIVDVMY